MRITSIFVEGFGIFCNYEIPTIAPGLTIVYGPNEAGKSTLLQFLRTILFGPPDARSRRENRYPPLAGGKHGGRIRFVCANGEFILDRDLTSPKAPATLTLPTGQIGKSQDLAKALGSVDERLFRTVFAFSLKDLENFEALDREALHNRLSSASVVGAGVNAADTAAEFRKRATELLSLRKGNESDVQKILDRIDELNTAIGDAKSKAAHYSELVVTIEQLRLRIESLAEQEEELRTNHTRLSSLEELWPTWLEKTGAEQKLAALPVVDNIPPNALERLGRTLDSVRSDGELQCSLSSEQVADEAELAKTKVDQAYVDIAIEVGSLYDELALFRSRVVDVAQLVGRIEQSDREIAALIETIGITQSDLCQINVSLPQREVIRGWQERLQGADDIRESAENDLREAQEELAASKETVRKLGTKLQTLNAPELSAIEEQERILRKVRANYSDLRAEEVSLASKTASIADRERALRILEREQPPSFGRLSTVLWVASATVALGSVWTFIGKHDWAWVFALFAFAFFLALGAYVLRGVASWSASKQSSTEASIDGNSADLKTLRSEAATHAQRIEGLRLELNEDSASLKIDEALNSQLIEQMDAQFQGLRRARLILDQLTSDLSDAQRRVAEGEAREEGAQDALEHARMEKKRASEEWQTWQSAMRLPKALTPTGTMEFCDKVGEYRAAVRGRDDLEKRKDQLGQEVKRWADSASDVARRVGSEAPTTDSERLSLEIQKIRDRCAHEQKQLDRQQALSDSIERRSKKLAGANAALAASHVAQENLFEEAGVTDEEQFRRKVEIFQERQRYIDIITARKLAIDRRAGSDANAEALVNELKTGKFVEWQNSACQSKQEIDEIKKTRDSEINELSKLELQRQALEESAEVVSLEMERTALLEEMSVAIKEWQICSLAELLITRTMDDFRKNRQPKVLSEASKAFAIVTSKRYDRIVSDEENGHELAILTTDGKRRSVEELSRGTQEQLYLCLRLGLATEMSTERRLPFIMDDVLVNFDEIRAENMAKAILQVADERQVLLFTCHASTVALFQRLARDTPIVELQPKIAASVASAS